MRHTIIQRVRPRFATAAEAEAWYASTPLPGLSGLTARELVDAGRGDEVLEYVAAVDAGVHS